MINLDEYAPHRTVTFNGEEIEVYGVDVAMFLAPMNQSTEDYTKEVMTKVEAFKKSDQSEESAEIFAQGMVESFAESMTRYTPGADIAEIVKKCTNITDEQLKRLKMTQLRKLVDICYGNDLNLDEKKTD